MFEERGRDGCQEQRIAEVRGGQTRLQAFLGGFASQCEQQRHCCFGASDGVWQVDRSGLQDPTAGRRQRGVPLSGLDVGRDESISDPGDVVHGLRVRGPPDTPSQPRERAGDRFGIQQPLTDGHERARGDAVGADLTSQPEGPSGLGSRSLGIPVHLRDHRLLEPELRQRVWFAVVSSASVSGRFHRLLGMACPVVDAHELSRRAESGDPGGLGVGCDVPEA